MTHATITITEDGIRLKTHVYIPEIALFLSPMMKVGWLHHIDNDLFELDSRITKFVYVEDGKVRLGKRWAQDLCADGGTEKGPFVGLQYAGYHLKELIEQGKIKVEFFAFGKQVEPTWPKFPDRDSHQTKDLIKRVKHLYKSTNQNCPLHGRRKLKPEHIWICCICTKADKVIGE